MVHTERSIAGDRKSQFSIQGFQKNKNPAQPKMIQIVLQTGSLGEALHPAQESTHPSERPSGHREGAAGSGPD